MQSAEINKFYSLVTGGVQGIGFFIVKKLLKRGDRVFVFDIFSDDHESVKNLKQLGVEYFCVDISSADSVQNGILQISQLDLLVNNAGITKDTLAIRMTEKDWQDVLDVNLTGTFFCSQQAIKKMIRQKKGYIINISSIVGQNGNSGQCNYAASKAGLVALTKSLAIEYGARNILVNSISPGFIQTDMTKNLPEKVQEGVLNRISLKRFGHPEDVANLVEFLSSGRADYITGSVIDINGGLF